MKILIAFILIFIILLIIIFPFKLNYYYENFDDYYPYLTATGENVEEKYKMVHTSYMPMFNCKDYIGLNWHLRFPYMIKPRYSYDDSNTSDMIKVSDRPKSKKVINKLFDDYAHLNELPLNMNKWYFGKKINCDRTSICPHAKLRPLLAIKDKEISGFEYDKELGSV